MTVSSYDVTVIDRYPETTQEYRAHLGDVTDHLFDSALVVSLGGLAAQQVRLVASAYRTNTEMSLRLRWYAKTIGFGSLYNATHDGPRPITREVTPVHDADIIAMANRCGLRDPRAFAVAQWGRHDPTNPCSGTGRTTRLALEALVRIERGERIALRSHTLAHTQQYVMRQIKVLAAIASVPLYDASMFHITLNSNMVDSHATLLDDHSVWEHLSGYHERVSARANREQ